MSISLIVGEVVPVNEVIVYSAAIKMIEGAETLLRTIGHTPEGSDFGQGTVGRLASIRDVLTGKMNGLGSNNGKVRYTITPIAPASIEKEQEAAPPALEIKQISINPIAFIVPPVAKEELEEPEDISTGPSPAPTTKSKDIQVGELWMAKVHGKVQKVRVDSITTGPEGKRFKVTNVSTGRTTSFKSRKKFRMLASRVGDRVVPNAVVGKKESPPTIASPTPTNVETNTKALPCTIRHKGYVIQTLIPRDAILTSLGTSVLASYCDYQGIEVSKDREAMIQELINKRDGKAYRTGTITIVKETTPVVEDVPTTDNGWVIRPGKASRKIQEFQVDVEWDEERSSWIAFVDGEDAGESTEFGVACQAGIDAANDLAKFNGETDSKDNEPGEKQVEEDTVDGEVEEDSVSEDDEEVEETPKESKSKVRTMTEQKTYGRERNRDLPWNAKKVALFKALRKLGAFTILGGVGSKKLSKASGLSERHVRHYSYHASAAGLIALGEMEDVSGYIYYLTKKGQKIDPDLELVKQQERRAKAKAAKAQHKEEENSSEE